MGLAIQHNIAAQSAVGVLNANVSGVKKTTEKLSSGYRINRAGDDAGGLAVSEKMQAQIGGLSQAIKNTSDGICLIQTAEGGLNETHAILDRMRELSVQAANGTYLDEDREVIQLELEALKSEIDRIAESTEYNGIKLPDGKWAIPETDKLSDVERLYLKAEVVLAREKSNLYDAIMHSLDLGADSIVPRYSADKIPFNMSDIADCFVNLFGFGISPDGFEIFETYEYTKINRADTVIDGQNVGKEGTTTHRLTDVLKDTIAPVGGGGVLAGSNGLLDILTPQLIGEVLWNDLSIACGTLNSSSQLNTFIDAANAKDFWKAVLNRNEVKQGIREFCSNAVNSQAFAYMEDYTEFNNASVLSDSETVAKQFVDNIIKLTAYPSGPSYPIYGMPAVLSFTNALVNLTDEIFGLSNTNQTRFIDLKNELGVIVQADVRNYWSGADFNDASGVWNTVLSVESIILPYDNDSDQNDKAAEFKCNRALYTLYHVIQDL